MIFSVLVATGKSMEAPKFHFIMSGYKSIGNPVYRVAMGDLMPSAQRKTFPLHSYDPEQGAQTGTIGFMDLIQRTIKLIPETTSSAPLYLPALTVLTVGIELQYQKQGYFPMFTQKLEEIAHELQFPAILALDVLNKNVERILKERCGYRDYVKGHHLVKLLRASDCS